MKTLKDLNLCDDYLFHEVMKDKRLVIGLLETVLDLKGEIQDIKYVEGEKTIKGGYTGKGIRVDVYVMDEELNVYDIEIQNGRIQVLGKRSRKYQSNMDYEFLKQGQSYDKLKKQYIIFICTGDPFGRGLYKYTFCNLCKEMTDLELGDETTKVFLNTKGYKGDVSNELKAFLKFVEESTIAQAEETDSDFVKALSERVEDVKRSEEIGGDYMTFEEKMIELAEIRAEEMVEERAEKLAEERAEKLAEERVEKLVEERLKENSSNIVRQIALNMKAAGIETEQIVQICGLSLDEIELL